MDKRGEGNPAWAVLLWGTICILILSILILSITDSTGNLISILGDVPAGVESVIQILRTILVPIAEGLFFIVAPAGQEENVQAIAVAIFLLLTLIGTKTLRPFIKGPFVAFLISFIIGVIAARSLTATILEESALAASPLTAIILVIGFLPIFALTKNVDKWGLNQWSKMAVFTFAAILFALIFAFAFKAVILGIFYAGLIIVLGVTQLMLPWFVKARDERKAESWGQYMAGVQSTIQVAEAMKKGSDKANREYSKSMIEGMSKFGK